jgi:hypothetical protein
MPCPYRKLHHRRWDLLEHWDVMQEEVPVEKTVNGNPMFALVSVE